MEGGIHITLKEKVKALPLTPGVYLMKDVHGSVIYVGKAKNLKRRVQSYFQKSASHSPKIIKLVNNITTFDFILTDTEFEAFMLECKLIKEIKPFFNKKMKSPQSYSFISIKMGECIPKIEVTNEPITNGQYHLFGPYISKHTVEKAIQGLKEFLKIDCSNPIIRKTPCLNYSLGSCIGMCFKDEAAAQYQTIIQKIIHLLNGTDKTILEDMKDKMLDASENLDFMLAAKYRDFTDALNFIIYKEEVIEFTEENKNIAVIEYLTDSTFKLFLIKRNQILFSQKFTIVSSNMEEVKQLIMNNIIEHFRVKEQRLSLTHMGKEELDEAQIIFSYLQSGSCSYSIIPAKWLTLEHPKLETAINKIMSQSPIAVT